MRAETQDKSEAAQIDAEMRVQLVKNMSHGDVSIEDYQFDSEENGWCKVRKFSYWPLV